MKPRIRVAPLGIGLAAGLVSAVFAIGIVMQIAPPFGRVLLAGGSITGFVSLILCVRWAEDLEARCEQYEEALRKHGIEMD